MFRQRYRRIHRASLIGAPGTCFRPKATPRPHRKRIIGFVIYRRSLPHLFRTKLFNRHPYHQRGFEFFFIGLRASVPAPLQECSAILNPQSCSFSSQISRPRLRLLTLQRNDNSSNGSQQDRAEYRYPAKLHGVIKLWDALVGALQHAACGRFHEYKARLPDTP